METEITAVETEVIQGFDYSTLKPDDRAFVEQQLQEIEMLLQRTWVEVAQRLIAIRDRIGDSLYQLIKSEEFTRFKKFGIGQAKAYQLIQAYSSLDRSAGEVLTYYGNEQRDEVLGRFETASVQPLLGAPKEIRDEAQLDAVARADRGETITFSKAKAIVEAHKQKSGLATGQHVTVVDPDSELFGSSVIVEAIDTYTVDCKVPGKDAPVRFIVSDISANPIAKTEIEKVIAPLPKVKPNIPEQMQSEISLLKEREDYLVDLLTRVARSSATLPAALRTEIEEAIA